MYYDIYVKSVIFVLIMRHGTDDTLLIGILMFFWCNKLSR